MTTLTKRLKSLGAPALSDQAFEASHLGQAVAVEMQPADPFRHAQAKETHAIAD